MQRHFHREQPPAKTPAAGPKPVLPMVQLPIFRVHYRRLEEYLAKVYRMEDFDFLRVTGAGPGLVPDTPSVRRSCRRSTPPAKPRRSAPVGGPRT